VSARQAAPGECNMKKQASLDLPDWARVQSPGGFIKRQGRGLCNDVCV
jgi:hypothetical protein